MVCNSENPQSDLLSFLHVSHTRLHTLIGNWSASPVSCQRSIGSASSAAEGWDAELKVTAKNNLNPHFPTTALTERKEVAHQFLGRILGKNKGLVTLVTAVITI